MNYVGTIIINSQLNLTDPNMEVGGVAYTNSAGFNEIIVDMEFMDAIITAATVQFSFEVPDLNILPLDQLYVILQTNPILNQFVGWGT